ncbi:MAG: phenylalanine--tRNA ligase subunit beta [Myxococcales bacterium]|nr:phenylalanine--tRNA ligase subunit beta [Polyangiaceae bacterium]MDW8251259.1 phenylalanine--tRNA ligase subunit beta [Myxococcales bacterium]
MKASYRWLCELIPGLERFPPTEVAERLTAAGLEIEGQSEFGAGTDMLRVAQVVTVEPHPSKSGLRLVTVDHGAGTQRVVCGASNVPDPGGLVVLAPLGATLPAVGLTISPRTIGGISSEGMLCSEKEMGIGEGSAGILILPSGEPGQPLPEALPSVRDTILEINVTPNRPDALGHVGLARELAVLVGLTLRLPRPGQQTGREPQDITILIEQEDRCPEYGASLVEGVTIGPSPLWVQHRLTSLGIRPINNVVDATNLVLLELGQPTHAFDWETIRGSEIRVRLARPGEKLVTLDGKEHVLDPDDLVIADAEGATGLAGVMGGARSEISPKTTKILLECAYFDPRSVRRTARRHGFHSEASHRFERGIDREGVKTAALRLLQVIQELCPGSRLTFGPVHVETRSYQAPRVRLRSERLDALLGSPVPFGEARAILRALGCEEVEGDDAQATFRIPGWRPDLTREADLIEEVARVRGFDRIEAQLPPMLAQPQPLVRLDDELRRTAIGLGLMEAVTYAFLAPSQLEALGAPAPVVRLTNPLTEERSVLRTSLLPGLLEATRQARYRGERGVRLFTLGRIFLAPRGGTEEALPTEPRQLAAVLAGLRPAYLARPEEYDVFDGKAVAVELVARALRREPSVAAFSEAERPAHLHPRGAGVVRVGNQVVGRFGLLHPDVIERMDLGGSAVVVELDLDALETLGRATPKAAPIPRLPAIARDMAFTVAEAIPAGEVEGQIREAAGDLCEQVELFDVFRGGSVPEGHRSLAFRVTYRDPLDRAGQEGARTLTDAEVEERHRSIVETISKRLGATLRQ